MSTAKTLNACDRRLREMNADLDIEARTLIRIYESHRHKPKSDHAAVALARLTIFVRKYGPVTDGEVHYCYDSATDSVLRGPARKVAGRPMPFMKIYKSHIDEDGGRMPGQRG